MKIVPLKISNGCLYTSLRSINVCFNEPQDPGPFSVDKFNQWQSDSENMLYLINTDRDSTNFYNQESRYIIHQKVIFG